MVNSKYQYLIFLSLFFSCKYQQSVEHSLPVSSNDSVATIIQPTPKIIDNDSILIQRTREVLTVIKNKDYRSLSEFIHPMSGIRFSPYGYIANTDMQFGKKEFLLSLKEQKKMHWGTYSGRGDSILLTVKKYFERFVYDVDFVKAEKLTVNSTNAKGSTINNQASFFKNLNYTESYFSGFDKKYEGLDWRALRLIFKKDNGIYFLIGIVHDEWTP